MESGLNSKLLLNGGEPLKELRRDDADIAICWWSV